MLMNVQKSNSTSLRDITTKKRLLAWFLSTKKVLLSLNPLNAFGLVLVPSIFIFYGLLYVRPATYTVIWAILYGNSAVHGITFGYHRLFSHKALRARNPTKFIILLLGTAAFQRSVLWWAREHRAHHKYEDTDNDPYKTTGSFWAAHIGWLLFKSEPSETTKLPIYMDDLTQDPMLQWQYDNYIWLSIVTGFIFPALVCCLWDDLWGGIFYACFVRIVLVQHSVFAINSFAHRWGHATFNDTSPRDSFVVALFTCGEGYHNFHHAFPYDYRSAPKFYQFDSTKWIIAGLSYIGQTYDLKITPERVIKAKEFQMKQKEMKKMVK